MEEEKEYVDREFQESEFINEEFKHGSVKDEDTSQGFVDRDSPPTYDDDVNEKNPIEETLASDLEEEYEEDGFFPMFDSFFISWKMKSPRMTSPIMKKMTSLIMKRLMKAFKMRCLIIMKKMLGMLISLALKIF
jgi:hypothetical protein